MTTFNRKSEGYFLLVLLVLILQCECLPVREVELNKNWILQNETMVLKNLEIPSGVFSALSPNDPEAILKSYNDVNMRWIAFRNWTYSREFETPENYAERNFVNLTFRGIDTISTIYLNGKIVGHTNNMFVRYSYNIKDLLNPKSNTLEIRLQSPVKEAKRLALENFFTPPECPPDRYHGECHMNFLRKMQASFGWDWGLAAPSMGIWKTVSLEIHDLAIIRDVDVIPQRKGDIWNLHIRVFLETGYKGPIYGELIIYAVDLFEPIKLSFNKNPILYENSVIQHDLQINHSAIELWWPNGYGKQKLYNIHFTWKGRFSNTEYNPEKWTISQKSIRIGFRTIELRQDLTEENTETFYFRINDVPIFMKGSNYIPSHILPEHLNDRVRVKHLLEQSKNAHMNMLRVWGGGIYESDYFYDMADYYGIMIWHDMMFACAMYPVNSEFLESVREETLQNAKRIAHHPSIALWATNNENELALAQNWYKTSSDYDRFAPEYRKLYVDTIVNALNVIAHEGRPKPVVSSPSNGLQSEKDDYLAKNPLDPNYGDIHYYNYILDGWNPVIYPLPRFVSEYGYQSLPSMTSWSKILAPTDNLSALIDHRQHSPLGNGPILLLVTKHLPLPSQDSSDYLEALIYFSQISQAMITKTETEVYRSQRSTSHQTMGALYWQLNDVWVAPSWSSIDYYGNFKILQYWAKDFMAPVSIIAHLDKMKMINVYIVRDTIDEVNMELNITLNIFLWSQFTAKYTNSWKTDIGPNSSKLVKTLNISDLLIEQFTQDNCFFEFTLQETTSEISSKTYLFPGKIKNAQGILNPQIEAELLSESCQNNNKIVSIAIKAGSPAIFVYIEFTNKDVARYSLSKNGYIQLVPIQTIHLEYEFVGKDCPPFNLNEVKILTVNKFMEK